MLKCEAKAEEGQEHQAFMEAFGAVMWACLPETHGALMYPLWLLTSNVPLAAILGMSATTQLWAMTDRGPAQTVADRGSVQTPPIPSVLGTLVPKPGVKCQCHSSDQGVPAPGQDEEEVPDIDDTPEECPHKKWKDRRLAGKALKEAQREAFSKESDVVKVARWAYQKAHRTNVEEVVIWPILCVLTNDHLH